MQSDKDESFMKIALQQAELAFDEGEIPVGAIIVADGKVIAKGYNQTEKLNDPTAHAEMIAITAAGHYLGSRHLQDCTLYVTLEPCAMCAGAIYWGQVGRIVYGASDEKRGFKSYSEKLAHPRAKFTTGVLEGECKELLMKFFKQLRQKRKK
ncbi:tRNA adenosine(34) deaminase TadA [Flammeovirga agarivorans]|uniref:tRNA-specific adenosine deaminase n=1 Tax=Flammeovirga agarivorans TaxID=2726742 RepID=A0A7X8SM87_9BACT|nr:tRNA adenosine(34) deaminase TadA [Flammeovirga agarivorans]NLR92755.1 nucleoside deaminase [Flammeovirga agarivorans]